MIEKPPIPLRLARLPTPLQFLERTSRRLGADIWVKRDDLTGSVESGNKIRKLEYSLAAARDQNADVVITCGSVRSNHCRATAISCARVQMRCRLVLWGDARTPCRGNLAIDRIAGASIRFITADEWRRRSEILREEATRLRADGARPFIIPGGASDAIGSLGYCAAGEEIRSQESDLEHPFTHVVVPVGSGGTWAGLVAGRARHGLAAEIVGVSVCDDAAYFRSVADRIFDDMRRRWWPDLTATSADGRILDGFKGAGYDRFGEAEFACIRRMAREEGLVFDPVYLAKAWRGLEALVGDLENPRVLFMHTGGLPGLLSVGDDDLSAMGSPCH